jgi:hypothetical protein
VVAKPLVPTMPMLSMSLHFCEKTPSMHNELRLSDGVWHKLVILMSISW